MADHDAPSFADLANEILTLQHSWSATNTPAMERRGILVRDALPDWIQRQRAKLLIHTNGGVESFEIQGRDGTGPKSEVPWVRYFSRSHSPTPQDGWYCVYLFHAKGDGFYLCLGHGSTRSVNGEFVPRPAQEVATLVDWARTTLSTPISISPSLLTKVDLGSRGKLGKAYAGSMAIARWYSKDALPSDEAIVKDTASFGKLLRDLYDAQDFGRAPMSIPPALQAAQDAIENVAKGTQLGRRGQGFGLTAPERAAVEQHAMRLARDKLTAEGYSVQDTSKTHSFDYLAQKEGLQITVEVKGTTSGLGQILLTANEVSQHQQLHPNNALIVVHSVELDRYTNPPVARGGILVEFRPWKIEPSRLRPLSYQYALATEDDSD